MSDNTDKCRSCMTEKVEMKSFEYHLEELPTITLCDIFTECTNLKVDADDSLPRQLCIHCENELKIAYSFKKRAEKSDFLFRDCIITDSNIALLKTDNSVTNFVKVEIKEEELEHEYLLNESTIDNNSINYKCNDGEEDDEEGTILLLDEQDEEFEIKSTDEEDSAPETEDSDKTINSNDKTTGKGKYSKNHYHSILILIYRPYPSSEKIYA